MLNAIVRTRSLPLAAAGLLIAGAMVACESDPHRTDTHRTTSRTMPRGDQQRSAIDRQSQTQTQTLAFPTGNRSDSVILLEKHGPASVRVGAPIEYQITVTNISDQPLEQVVVYDALPQRFLAHGQNQGNTALARGQQPDEAAGQQPDGIPQPGQEVFLYFAEPESEAGNASQQPTDRPMQNQPRQQLQLRPQPGQSETMDSPEGSSAAPRQDSRQNDLTRDNAQTSQQAQAQSMRAVDQPIDQPDEPMAQGRASATATDRPGALDDQGISLAQANRTLASAQSDGAGQWFIGSLAPGEKRTITLQGYADAPGTLQSCTTVAYQPAVCFATEVTQPLLRVERDVPQTVNACEPFTIRYRVTNVGTGPTSNVIIREQLPEGLMRTQAQTQQGQAGEAGGQAGEAGGQAGGQAGSPIELRADALAQGQSREFTVTAVAQRGGQFTTQAIAIDEQGNQIRSSQTQIIARQAELELAIRAPEQVYLGRPLPLEITVTNRGDAPAQQVTVTHQVPTGARLAQTDNRATQQRDGVSWQLGTIPAGQSVTLNSALSLGEPADLTIQAVAQGLCVADAATASANTAVTGLAAILLEVVDTRDPVPVGEQEVYTVRVTNQGTVADTNIRVQVDLPENMTFVSANPPAQAQPMAQGQQGQQGQQQPMQGQQGQLGQAGQPGQANALAQAQGNSIRFTIPSLPPGETRELQVTAQAQQPGDVRLQVQMTSDQLTEPVIETEATRLY